MLRTLLQSLQRRTTTGLYIPQVDGLRLVAISGVFFYHLAGDIQRHSPAGPPVHSLLFQVTQQLNVGVLLFFAISGMILGLPFASHFLKNSPPILLRRYLVRRLTRLEPPYIAALLLFSD